MSRALHASPSDLATGVAAVAVATIARAADVEALGAHAAANLPEAVLHESPCERAEKLSPRRGSCETNRASVCCRVPESPGSSPGLSLFRRAACRRSLGSARAPANFPAARARPRRYDVSGGNLRIGEAINRLWMDLRTRASARRSEQLGHPLHVDALVAIEGLLRSWLGDPSAAVVQRDEVPLLVEDG